MTSSTKVLVVGGDVSLGSALPLVLSDYEVELVAAASLAEALELFATGIPADLVLANAELPDGSGTTLLRELRSRANPPEIVLLASHPTEPMMQDAVGLGVSDVVALPVTDMLGVRVRLGAAMARVALRKREQQLVLQLGAALERVELVCRITNDGVWEWDVGPDTLRLSDKWKALLGHADNEIGGDWREWLSRLHLEDRAHFESALTSYCGGDSEQFLVECRMRHKDGNHRWMDVRGIAVRGVDGRVARVVGSMADISGRKSAEEQIFHDVFHDPLTTLANRALFKDRVGRALAVCKRQIGYVWAVVTLGVDGLKLINQSLGPQAGDELLREIAGRLRQRFVGTDTVARLAGDEFGILVEALQDSAQVATVLVRVHDAFHAPFSVAGRDIYATSSMGVAMGAASYESATEVMRDAYVAMYRAKASGRGRHAVFEPGMHTQAVDRFDLDTDLRRAVERRQLHLAYQPIISLKTGGIQGFEALARWRHPLRGHVSPAEFIPLAESNGLIVDIGHWVLDEACKQLEAWQRKYPGSPALTMSVNVSERQLTGTDFTSHVGRCLKGGTLAPESLKLEITESALISDFEGVGTKLMRLKELGVQLAMDDFGTGYSALSYLHRLPFDILKIDRSFVRDLAASPKNAALVDATISLAHRLGLTVTAEGIETGEQLEELRRLGCELGQGFLFSRPVDADQAEKLLTEKSTW